MVPFYEFKPCAGDASGNKPGVGGFYHVPRPGDDQSFRLYSGKLGGLQGRVLHHQAEHFRIGSGSIAFFREKRGNAVAEDYGQLHGGLHSPAKKIAAVEDEPAHPMGIAQGKHHGDIGTVGKAQNMGLFNAHFVHEAAKILRKAGNGELRGSSGTLAVTSGVRGDDPEIRREGLQLGGKIAAVFTVAMEQQQSLALPLFNIMQLYIHVILHNSPNEGNKPVFHPGRIFPVACKPFGKELFLIFDALNDHHGV